MTEVSNSPFPTQTQAAKSIAPHREYDAIIARCEALTEVSIGPSAFSSRDVDLGPSRKQRDLGHARLAAAPIVAPDKISRPLGHRKIRRLRGKRKAASAGKGA